MQSSALFSVRVFLMGSLRKASINIFVLAVLLLTARDVCALNKERFETQRYYAVASDAYKRKRYSKADALLSTIIAADPSFYKARFARAEVLFAMGRFEDAFSEVDLALTKKPNIGDGFMTRANCLIELGRKRLDRSYFDRAIKDYSRVIELQPRNDVAYNNRGLCYSHKGDYQRALRDWDTACRLDPREAKYPKNRAGLFCQLGLYAKAKAEYEKARLLEPKNFYRYYDFGRFYFSRGETAQAIKDLDTCIKLNRNWADAYVYRGLAHFDLENYRSAIADFTSAIDRDSHLKKSCYRYRGLAYLQLGNKDLAANDLEKFSDDEISKTHFEAGLDPDLKKQGLASADVFIARGLDWEQKGKIDQAIEEYSRAIDVDRQSVGPYKFRAHAFAMKNDLSRAIADYDLALWLDPFEPDALLQRALAFEKRGWTERALWELNRAIASDPTAADSYFEKARICRRLKRNSEAALNYLRFLKLAKLQNDKATNQNLLTAKEALKQLENH